MNRLTRWILHSLPAALLFLAVPLTGISSAEMNVLEQVTTQSRDDELVLRFQFQNPVSGVEDPEFFQKIIQLQIPRATLRSERKSYRTDDEWVPHVFVSNTGSGSLQARFILGREFQNPPDHFEVESDGRTLVVRIQKAGPDVLEKILARAAEQVKRPEEEFPRVRSRSRPASGLAEDSREKENPPRNFTSVALAQTPDPPPPRSSPSPKPSSGPAEKKSTFAKSKPKTLSAGESLNLLPSGLKMLGMLSVVLGLLFLLFYGFKKFALKNTVFGGGHKTIQVLGTGFLGPRKNIAIVEVAGEVLVLGVSNDNISLLATIREKDRIEQIKNEGNGGSFWSSAKSTGSSPDRSSLSPRTIQAFAKYLQEYSSTRVGREKSPSQVAAEIRKNIGKLKTV